MRRLLRILLNAATVLSLVLCVVTMAGWVRSYQAWDNLWWSRAKPQLLGINTYGGGLKVGLLTPFRMDNMPAPGAGWRQFSPLTYAEVGYSQGTFYNRLGFSSDSSQNSEYVDREFTCPYWFIMLLTAILPAARLAGWRRRRRRARRLRMGAGLCQHCGYDCRATPDRCPECGRETNAATDAA